jgi:hypothetical protein
MRLSVLILLIVIAGADARAQEAHEQGLVIADAASQPIVEHDEFSRVMVCYPPTAAHARGMHTAVRNSVVEMSAGCLERLGVREIRSCESIDLDGKPHSGFSMATTGVVYVSADPRMTLGDLKWTIAHLAWHIWDIDGITGRQRWPPDEVPFDVKDDQVNVPGFATRYATSNILEDRADTFAALVVLQRMIHYRASRDAILCEKLLVLAAESSHACPSLMDALEVSLPDYDD